MWMCETVPPAQMRAGDQLLLRHLHWSGDPELAEPHWWRPRDWLRSHYLVVHTKFHTHVLHRQWRCLLCDPVMASRPPMRGCLPVISHEELLLGGYLLLLTMHTCCVNREPAMVCPSMRRNYYASMAASTRLYQWLSSSRDKVLILLIHDTNCRS